MMLFILSTAIFRDVQVEKGDSEGMHEDPNLLYQLNYCNLRGGNFAPTESETSKNIVFILFMLNMLIIMFLPNTDYIYRFQ